MIILQTDSFKIDLTPLNVKFSEENSFFQKDLIKRYSFPFGIPKERNFIPFFHFLSSHNSQNSSNYIKGTLFLNDKFYDAELVILAIQDKINVVLYYDFLTVDGFTTPLKDMNWGTVTAGDDMFAFADQTILQNYPATKINFPKIYAPELHANYGFGTLYQKGINYKKDDDPFSEIWKVLPYSPTSPPISKQSYQKELIDSYQMNEMRPFLYLKEVLFKIADFLGFTITGDFVNNPNIEKCLLYHENNIFFTNNGTNEVDVNLVESGFSSGSYREFIDDTLTFDREGTMYIKLNFKGSGATPSKTFNVELQFPSFNFAAYSNQFVVDGNGDVEGIIEAVFNVPKSLVGTTFKLVAGYSSAIIPNFDETKIEITGTNRPLYNTNIELKDLLPDMAISEFLNSIKNGLNLTSSFNSRTQEFEFNFFQTSVNESTIIDISNFVIPNPSRTLNNKLGFKIPFEDGEIVGFDKEANFTAEYIGFPEYSLQLQPLKLVQFDSGWASQNQSGLSILFFEANPEADSLYEDNGVQFTREGYISEFLSESLYQDLNAEDYDITVFLPIYIAAKINSECRVWCYNNYFMVKQLDRQSVNPYFQKLVLRLYKLKRPGVN